jgi:cytochrome P450
MIPPKPKSRAERVSLWRYMRLFRRDILSAQPEKLYRAWMAEFKTPFFRSYMINDPGLIDLVLKVRPGDFPKSERVGAGLRPILGNSVFLTNGATWKRQRRIIDPSFEGGRLKETYEAMKEAADAAAERLIGQSKRCEVEFEASHATADVIFRTLFSIPIEHETATQVFDAFRRHQKSQPILNLAAFVPVPHWVPRFFRRESVETARMIRSLITDLTRERLADIEAGTAPDDLATKIMTTCDPVTGDRFDLDEMIDQVAIFFLAGHETSAAALSWGLYLLATHPEWQEAVADEARGWDGSFAGLSKLRVTRDVFRETLRLYPPVPMMVREATRAETFRKRAVRKGAQIVLSPWHLHRNPRFWTEPDLFDPARWSEEATKDAQRTAYMPFSAGPRVCTGAGFAMVEGVLLLARLVAAYRFEPIPDRVPVPEAQLTVRSRNGIWLNVIPRDLRDSDPKQRA